MKKFVIAFIFILILNIIFSNEELKLNSFFNSDEIETVLKGQIITRMYITGDIVKENTDKIIIVPKTKYANEDFLIYEMITDEKAFIPYKITDDKDKLKFYNTITACSKLKGMKYFSRRISKTETLILDSYLIESKDNKKKIEDKTYTSIPETNEGYYLQKDNRFGNLIFRIKLINEGFNFILINTCVNKIDKLTFKIFDEGEYKVISYFIYDKENNGFFYYSVNVMRIKSEVLINGNDFIPPLYPTTFSNRLRGATVHLAKLLGLNWDDKINPWDEDFLKKLRKSKKVKK